MAQSMSPALPTVLLPPNTVTRSNSTASTNSQSSAVSLKRRARTRTRATSIVRRGKSVGPSAPPAHGDDKGDGHPAGHSQSQVPPLPTRSHRQPDDPSEEQTGGVQELRIPPARERAWSTVHIRDVPPEALRGRQAQSDSGSTKQARARARGMSLPRSAFRPAASSDESSIASPRTPTGPFDAPFVRPRPGNSQHFRDSVISSSSSIYPKSTSTESYPESSLRSIGGKDEMSPFGAPRIVTGNAEFDVDDVSYRLRLLVNNSYFLPPAHSKPSPLALAPQKPAIDPKSAKTSAPTFFDFFRMGKSKSKPSSPLAMSPPAVDPMSGPILRTTSDSSTASGRLPHTQPHLPTETPLHSSTSQAPPTRVVVLREQMDDLIEAAKQAERDIKLRGDGRKAKSQTAPSDLEDVIDPTDAVDLPPPPSAYPFAVQTSTLHGLGPGESLGAALLADALPPSPGMWSMTTEEETWRKAILQEAVSLSLNDSSPERSFSSLSSPSNSPQSMPFRANNDDKTKEPASPPTPKVASLIGQRIMQPEKIVVEATEGPTLSPLSGLQPLPSTVAFPTSSPKEPAEGPWKATLHPPRRAETPAAHSPLTPPPVRRQLSHPQYSMSSSELSRPRGDSEQSMDSETLHTLRKAVSDPRLAARHGEARDVAGAMSPPPESLYQRIMSPLMMEPSRTLTVRPSVASLVRLSPFSDDDDLSYATPGDGDMDDEAAPRPSMTLSIPTGGRPSMSDYSNPSPTTSAFQDAVFGSCRSPSPLLFRRSHAGAIGTSTLPSPNPDSSEPSRLDAMSPPPRPSTAGEGSTILPPPPRTPANKPLYRPSTSSSASAHSSQSRTPLHTAVEPDFDRESSIRISPSTQSPTSTLPLAERRGLETPLSLQIPSELISPAIHSAPAPASPTAFFDRIQSHPNAMDDLETSDESDAEDMAAPVVQSPISTTANVSLEGRSRASSTRSSMASTCSSRSTRPSFMRFGNHSTPQLSPSPSVPAFDIPDPKMPIGHIAEKGTFFTSRSRKKSGKSSTTKTFTKYSNTLEFPVRASNESAAGPSTMRRQRSTPRRPATSSAAEGGSNPRAFQRESILKFDGMLMDHIASERDTIKRITHNLSGSRS